jgi:hypothetical protein
MSKIRVVLGIDERLLREVLQYVLTNAVSWSNLTMWEAGRWAPGGGWSLVAPGPARPLPVGDIGSIVSPSAPTGATSFSKHHHRYRRPVAAIWFKSRESLGFRHTV